MYLTRVFFLLVAASCCWARSPEMGLSFSPYMRLNYDGYSNFRDSKWIVHATGRMPILSIVWFPGPLVALGPEFTILHLNKVKEFDSKINAFFLGGRCVLFFMNPDAHKGLYVLGHSGVLGTKHYLNEDFDFSAGPGIGYSWRREDSVTIGLEGRYARWVDNEIHDLSLLIRLGFGL